MGMSRQNRLQAKRQTGAASGHTLPRDRLAWRRQRFLEVQKFWQDKMTGKEEQHGDPAA